MWRVSKALLWLAVSAAITGPIVYTFKQVAGSFISDFAASSLGSVTGITEAALIASVITYAIPLSISAGGFLAVYLLARHQGPVPERKFSAPKFWIRLRAFFRQSSESRKRSNAIDFAEKIFRHTHRMRLREIAAQWTHILRYDPAAPTERDLVELLLRAIMRNELSLWNTHEMTEHLEQSDLPLATGMWSQIPGFELTDNAELRQAVGINVFDEDARQRAKAAILHLPLEKIPRNITAAHVEKWIYANNFVDWLMFGTNIPKHWHPRRIRRW